MEGAPAPVRVGVDVPSPDAGVAAGRVPAHPRRPRPVLPEEARAVPPVECPRQRHGEGAERGGDAGPIPTDRAKLGVKRHILSDGRGVPLSAVITGANVHDKWLVGRVLDAIVAWAPRWPRRPTHLCLDEGYDCRDGEAAVRDRGIIPHIRRRGENALVGRVHGRPRRWVVERTLSWQNRFRGLLVRWGTSWRELPRHAAAGLRTHRLPASRRVLGRALRTADCTSRGTVPSLTSLVYLGGKLSLPAGSRNNVGP